MAKGVVRGDKELIANIRRAYNSVGGRALDENLLTSLEPMKDQTQENARALRNYPGKHPGWPDPPASPRGGHLDQGLVTVIRFRRGLLFREAWLTFTRRAKKLAHLVEYGTAPHWQPGLKFMHPGARAQPFARQAFEETKDEVVASVGKNVWSRISGSIRRTLGR